MRFGIRVLERLDEEAKQHFEWTKKWSALTSVLIGVGISLLVGFGGLFGSQSKWSLENVLLTISGGLISGAVSYQFSIIFMAWILFKRKEVAKALDEMDLMKRMGDTLGSLLFFVKSSNFEETLKWFNHDHALDVKNIIAKVIFKQLNRSFEANAIKLYIQSYGEHSKIISEIMEDAKDICFTCIKAPCNWFKALDKIYIEHDSLPNLGLETPYFDRSKLLELGYDEARVDLYPTHYIKFLNNNNHGIRKRVFLLGEDEWRDLIDTQYYDYFKKFMTPCHRRIDTLFVRVKELEDGTKIANEHISHIVKEAIDSNITKEDYDIFEKHALMVYKNISDSVHLLEFRVGGKTKEYSALIEFLFASRNKKYGIYSTAEIDEMITSNRAITH